MKLVPWSVRYSIDTLCLETTCSTKVSAIIFALKFWSGNTSTHLLKQSTTIKRNRFPVKTLKKISKIFIYTRSKRIPTCKSTSHSFLVMLGLSWCCKLYMYCTNLLLPAYSQLNNISFESFPSFYLLQSVLPWNYCAFKIISSFTQGTTIWLHTWVLSFSEQKVSFNKKSAHYSLA